MENYTKCKICGNALVKNGIKNGVQYYYCTHCKKSYSGKDKAPSHHIFEEYIARLMYLHCVLKKNEFTHTTWNINQIARLLDHRHQDVEEWAKNKTLPKISSSQFIKYLEQRENGTDILCILGYRQASEPSETIKNIITRKQRAKSTDSGYAPNQLTEPEYMRLVNLPISNRIEAIFVLGALLGCRTNEIIGAKYTDIDYDHKTIYFQRIITFGKEIEISEISNFISRRTYPLTAKMLSIIEWLKADQEKNKAILNADYNAEYCGFLCVQENGNIIISTAFNNFTQKIAERAGIMTANTTKYGIRNLQFRWLRCTVKSMMLKAGVTKEDIKAIFGNNQFAVDIEKMRKAYELLDKYIDENSKQYLS